MDTSTIHKKCSMILYGSSSTVLFVVRLATLYIYSMTIYNIHNTHMIQPFTRVEIANEQRFGNQACRSCELWCHVKPKTLGFVSKQL